jgi:pimeloyl-ACP methyl ester carboxylesterase
MKERILATTLALALFASITNAGTPAWHDPSPHKVRFVTVDPDVRLEVLDWGGTGRPIVLIPGLGGSAHTFDDFALKFKPYFHVFGLSPRGFGASSVPKDGYSSDRLGDDVVAVLNSLNLQKPILVGHSFGGLMLSSVATRHPDRIAGVIYLDAWHTYDKEWTDEGLYMIVSWKKQLRELQDDLKALEAEPEDDKPIAHHLIDKTLPQMRVIAEQILKIETGRPPFTDPTRSDLESYATLRAWYARVGGVWVPEAEARQMFAATPDGRPTMNDRSPEFVTTAMLAGKQRYNNIQVPALMLMAAMNDPGKFDQSDPKARENAEAFVKYQNERAERRIALFKRDVPNGRVVLFQKSGHLIYLAREPEVILEMRSFAESLPK